MRRLITTLPSVEVHDPVFFEALDQRLEISVLRVRQNDDGVVFGEMGVEVSDFVGIRVAAGELLLFPH